MVWKTPLIRTGLLGLCKPSEAILGTLHREASVKMQRWNGACHFGLGWRQCLPLFWAQRCGWPLRGGKAIIASVLCECVITPYIYMKCKRRGGGSGRKAAGVKGCSGWGLLLLVGASARSAAAPGIFLWLTGLISQTSYFWQLTGPARMNFFFFPEGKSEKDDERQTDTTQGDVLSFRTLFS